MEQYDKRIISKLIKQIASGKVDSLNQLYSLTGKYLLSVALGIVHNRQLAEDILHDSFIKIVENASSFRTPSNGYSWLCSIVRNTALNKLRYEKLRQNADIDDCFNLSSKDDTTALIVNQQLKEVLQKLDEIEQKIIWFKYYNDMTLREISLQLNMPPSTINYIQKRAEEKMKKLL